VRVDIPDCVDLKWNFVIVSAARQIGCSRRFSHV